MVGANNPSFCFSCLSSWSRSHSSQIAHFVWVRKLSGPLTHSLPGQVSGAIWDLASSRSNRAWILFFSSCVRVAIRLSDLLTSLSLSESESESSALRFLRVYWQQ